jgi:hypothetical protein
MLFLLSGNFFDQKTTIIIKIQIKNQTSNSTYYLFRFKIKILACRITQRVNYVLRNVARLLMPVC